ncbi:hypothetical protein DFH09DRAFT_1306873 [Mycena vulgaris]|nr:hypothetical protein DFH09DRAFT_1306873 [Mycena vulgaris]
MNKKPLGKPWAMGIDNTICRWGHFGMIKYRPAVHCPHIGPTGGDMCNERSYYAATLNNPFALPFVAGATAPGPSAAQTVMGTLYAVAYPTSVVQFTNGAYNFPGPIP